MRTAIAGSNPDGVVTQRGQRVNDDLLRTLITKAGVVLDCTDNVASRHALNRACVVHGKPLVSGAAIRMDGQVSVYDTRDPASPCYACVFQRTRTLKRRSAPHWVCLRHWWASWVLCKRPKHSSCSRDWARV